MVMDALWRRDAYCFGSKSGQEVGSGRSVVVGR